MPLLLALGDEEVLIAIAIPLTACVIIAVTGIITGHLRKSQRDDMEATLKMEMIQRGMAVEEIERVLSARMGKPSKHRKRHAQYQMQLQHQYQQRQQGAPVAGR